MRPMPRSWLIHSVTHGYNPVADNDGVTTYTQQTLNFVRIEPTGKIVYGNNNTQLQLTSMMFYDCQNSRPKAVTFVEGDVIIYNGRTYTIEIVDSLSDNRVLHHIELGLI